jgi:glycerol-3-phosphate O-acyltransferase
VSRSERLSRVQRLADRVLARIGSLMPVTSVPLACAALQSLGKDFVSHHELVTRMAELRDVLVELNGRVVRADRDIEETFERAFKMLEMRRVLAKDGQGYALLPHSKPLVSYYANSIAHLLGPFEAAVRARDSLPALELVPA